MVKEELEQSEIDDLLGKIISAESISEAEPEKEAAFSKEVLENIQLIFEQTTRGMTKYFASLFGHLCSFNCASVDVVTYGAFTRSISNPSANFIIEWLGEKFVIQIEPSLTIQFLYGELMQMAGKNRHSRPPRLNPI